MKVNNKIARIISNVMVSALYLGFFFVQLTANFDLQNQSSNQQFAGSPKAPSKHIQFDSTNHAIKKTFSSVSYKHNIRLNKRFFPESAPVISKVELIVEAVSIVEINTPTYANPFIKGISLDSFSRRGPPVVG